MIKKLVGVLIIVGITVMISGCSDNSDNKMVTKNPVKEEVRVPEVMPEPIKDDCLKRFSKDSTQVHWKLCGGDCKSEGIKWVYTDKGLEVFQKYSCGFGVVCQYSMYGTSEHKWWGFRK